MDGLNRVMLLGNLGSDPELRYTQGGQAVLNLRMATTESYLDKDKVRRERTDWHNIVIWGARGEALAKILAKGSSLFVEGSLRTSSYDDREGQKRYRTDIHATEVILTGGRGHGGADRADGDRSHDDAGRASPPAGEGGYSNSAAARAPGSASATRASASGDGGAKSRGQGPVADDRDLDGERGNPTVRLVPRDWDGDVDCKGKHYSECPPAFLDMLADMLQHFGENPKQGKEQYAQNDLRDAARARGWAARLRRGSGGGARQTAPAGGGAQPGGAAGEYGGGDYGGGGGGAGGDDDIPF